MYVYAPVESVLGSISYFNLNQLCPLFSYGYHRWAIAFTRQEKTVGVFLVWRNPSEGKRVNADFSVTLLNREHFSQNICFARKGVRFTKEAQGKSQD